MDYNQAIEWIHGASKYGVKLGTDNIKLLLELLGNPQDHLKYVHIAGTNGKGSQSAFLNSIFTESGYKTGVFTSPYVVDFRERICINYKMIEKERLIAITQKIKDISQKMAVHPTVFEIITAIAFVYFREENCDIVILETGLGGRLDSTNVIKHPLLAIITTISLDHMHILGDTLEKIAKEKAGIIKENTDVLIYEQTKSVEEVFKKACKDTRSVLHKADFSSIKLVSRNIDYQTFYFENRLYKTSLLGDHQLKNASLAILAANLLKKYFKNINDYKITKGIEKAKWTGRIEVLRKDPVFVIDGAHNLEGAKALKNTISSLFTNDKVIYIVGILKDKEHNKMLEAVITGAKQVYTVTPNNNRALDARELAKEAKNYCKNVKSCDSIQEAIRESLEIAKKDEIICAFGSLYYIGEVKELLKLQG